MSERKSVTVVIVGRVQGVGYRAWTRDEADARRITGHVRNREDGAVEAALTGPAPAVDAMLQACRSGPPGACVERIDVVENDAGPQHAGFAIMR